MNAKVFLNGLNKHFLLLSLVLTSLGATKAIAVENSFGSPDTERELRLQNMFEKYNSEPVDEDKWQSMLGARGSESYRVQTGDTLWDLSETMFGDGSYWPKLWSENHSIENPHQIVPKSSVRFIAGNEAQAPTVRIEASEAPKPYYVEEVHENLTAEEIAGGSIIEDPDVIGRRPEIPPTSHKSQSTLKLLPPSFVDHYLSKNGKKRQAFDITGLDVGTVKALSVPASVTLNSFITSEYPRKLGFVKEMEVQEATASILQNVFLELGRKVKVGERLNIVVIKDDITDEDGKNLGHIVEVNGSVEVTEIVDEEEGIYKAIVVDCVTPIVLKASVTDEPLPKASFAFNGPRKDIKGTIVGGEYSNDRKILGTASVIYLNVGADSGVQPGDLLAVHSIRKSRRNDTALKNVGRPIGVIKVAKVSQNSSTAIILNTIDEIRPGDMTGGEYPVQKEYTIGSREETIDVDQIDSEKPDEYKEDFDLSADPVEKPDGPQMYSEKPAPKPATKSVGKPKTGGFEPPVSSEKPIDIENLDSF